MQVPEPEFEGQTKTRLGNPEVRKIVEGIVTQVSISPEAYNMYASIAYLMLWSCLAASTARAHSEMPWKTCWSCNMHLQATYLMPAVPVHLGM